jgi:hypothetical protein
VTSGWLASVVAVVAIAMTYLICVRPHLRGRRTGVESQSENQAVDRQLADLRDDLRALRDHNALDGGRVRYCATPTQRR